MKPLTKHEIISARPQIFSNPEMDYPGQEYTILALQMLKEALELYEKTIRNENAIISLSNGEVIDIAFIEQCIAHLLGFDCKQIINSGFLKEKIGDDRVTTYQILKLIADNPNEIIEANKINNLTLINPYRINVRCKLFKDLINYKDMKFIIVDLNKDLMIKKDANNMNSRYFLMRETNEAYADYSALGIAKDAEGKNYLETFIVLSKADNAMFLQNQKILLPTKMIIKNEPEMTLIPSNLSIKTKLEYYNTKLKDYQSIIDISHYAGQLIDENESMKTMIKK